MSTPAQSLAAVIAAAKAVRSASLDTAQQIAGERQAAADKAKAQAGLIVPPPRP